MNDWNPCSVKPKIAEKVLVWHRVRPWCRFCEPVVGWWNGREWRREMIQFVGQLRDHGIIYQPKMWKHIDPPTP